MPPPDCRGPAPGTPSRTFWGAALQCDPYYGARSTYGTVQVHHDSIVPGGTHSRQSIGSGCDTGLEDNDSAQAELTTSLWGDIARNCIAKPCGPPDGVVNITTDVSAVVDKFRNLDGAPIKSRCDLEPGRPDLLINVSDATEVLDAFRGLGYPFPVPDPCP